LSTLIHLVIFFFFKGSVTLLFRQSSNFKPVHGVIYHGDTVFIKGKEDLQMNALFNLAAERIENPADSCINIPSAREELLKVLGTLTTDDISESISGSGSKRSASQQNHSDTSSVPKTSQNSDGTPQPSPYGFPNYQQQPSSPFGYFPYGPPTYGQPPYIFSPYAGSCHQTQYPYGPPPHQYQQYSPPYQYQQCPPPHQYQQGPPPQHFQQGPPPQQQQQQPQGPPPYYYQQESQQQHYQQGTPPHQQYSRQYQYQPPQGSPPNENQSSSNPNSSRSSDSDFDGNTTGNSE
jgi:hypothetical protein